MAVSLAPLASVTLLSGNNWTDGGRRSSLPLPLAQAVVPAPASRILTSFLERKLQRTYFTLQKVSHSFHILPRRTFMLVQASLETDGNDASGSELPPLEGSDEPLSVENLPLESKQKMLAEQKLRMKLAKKIRLRRKRLLRKRRMRKKGRWPPSKVKKNKNV
ncbi:50S ribosomal protein 5, chloroplastic [Apostasia shenzhenica]|uniref:50S ribosomal protein 5, chloroplastic n=1 Tax=Apostasia shenzhenica TaxID=1088818 RepID=A0A2I0A3P6_9ASPA|nr:50S ribosomal protein 5, chloroplastic [Apostasia shenzhenica]